MMLSSWSWRKTRLNLFVVLWLMSAVLSRCVYTNQALKLRPRYSPALKTLELIYQIVTHISSDEVKPRIRENVEILFVY